MQNPIPSLLTLPDCGNKTGWPWTEVTPLLPPTMPGGSPWPKISIVTPSYNQGQYIEETIRSVLLQGYPNLEYIIIDGGSTDGSVEIIKKYEPWLTYWESGKDRGQSHAINKGIQKATGQLFAWLNSDDIYMPRKLYHIAEGYCLNSEVGIFYGDAVYIATDSSLLSQIICQSSYNLSKLLFSRPLPQPSVFVNMNYFNQIGYLNEELNYCMEFDWWLRFSNLTSAYHIPYIISGLRCWQGQKTQDGLLLNQTKEEIRVLEKFVCKNNISKNQGFTAISVHLFRCLISCLANDEQDAALELADKMKNYDQYIVNAEEESLWLGVLFNNLDQSKVWLQSGEIVFEKLILLAKMEHLVNTQKKAVLFYRRIKFSFFLKNKSMAFAIFSKLFWSMFIRDFHWLAYIMKSHICGVKSINETE